MHQQLFRLKMKMMCSKLVEDDGDMLEVLRPWGDVDKNIIKEIEHKPVQVGAEDVVHQSLKSCWCIGETKRHDQELKVAVMSPKRCLGDIIRVHAHLVVTQPEIEIGEEAHPM